MKITLDNRKPKSIYEHHMGKERKVHFEGLGDHSIQKSRSNHTNDNSLGIVLKANRIEIPKSNTNNIYT